MRGKGSQTGRDGHAGGGARAAYLAAKQPN